MNNDISISHLEKCTCSGHMLEVERFVLKWKEGDEDGFSFSCWELGHRGGNMSWKERIRWCWHLLTKGTLWADSIIVTNEQARNVATFILKNLPNENSRK